MRPISTTGCPALGESFSLETTVLDGPRARQHGVGPFFFLSEPQWGTAVHDRILFTSESVTEGHPDKVADAISDAVLDAILTDDPTARVACETLVTTGLACVAGEITTTTYVDIPNLVRSTIDRIGYNDATFGFDSKTCA